MYYYRSGSFHLTHLILQIRDSLGDIRSNSIGDLTVPSNLGVGIHLEVVKGISVISHKPPESGNESDFEITEAQVANSNP